MRILAMPVSSWIYLGGIAAQSVAKSTELRTKCQDSNSSPTVSLGELGWVI